MVEITLHIYPSHYSKSLSDNLYVNLLFLYYYLFEGFRSGKCIVGKDNKKEAYAETSKTDLIAVGCRGLKGIKGMMKSLSRNILNHSSCSVLIGKSCK